MGTKVDEYVFRVVQDIRRVDHFLVGSIIEFGTELRGKVTLFVAHGCCRKFVFGWLGCFVVLGRPGRLVGGLYKRKEAGGLHDCLFLLGFPCRVWEMYAGYRS